MSNKYLPAKPGNLSRQGDGQVATQHTYITEGSIERCLDYGFFNSVRNQFLPGDSIKIIQIEGRVAEMRKAILVASRKVIIVSVKDSHVDFRPEDEKTFYYTEMKKSPEEKVKVPFDVKWNIGTNSYRILEDGEVISEVFERSEAEAIKKGEMQPPSEKEVKIMKARIKELKENPSAKDPAKKSSKKKEPEKELEEAFE